MIEMFFQQAWLAGVSPCPFLVINVDQAVLSDCKGVVMKALQRNLQGPKDHMESYGE